MRGAVTLSRTGPPPAGVTQPTPMTERPPTGQGHPVAREPTRRAPAGALPDPARPRLYGQGSRPSRRARAKEGNKPAPGRGIDRKPQPVGVCRRSPPPKGTV